MPLLKHAIKKMRQDAKRTLANKAKKTTMRTAIKKARTEQTLESLSAAFAKLDKAAKTHLIHKNKASRLKSRLAKAINKAVGAVAPTPVKETKTKKTTKAKAAPATESVVKKPRATKKAAPKVAASE